MLSGTSAQNSGYVFAPDYWNHDYATEACQKIVHYALGMGIVRIQAVVDPDNKASERVLQKLNMTYEGLLRSYMIVHSKSMDRKLYAIVTNNTQS